MGIESDFIWMDGELVPYEKATIHVLSHTLHYGVGVFEGIRSYEQASGGGGVFRLDEHIKRFVDSARMCRIPLPYSQEQIREACLETMRANKFDSAYLRPIAFWGAGAMGLGARNNPVHVVVAAWPWGTYLGGDALETGIRAGISSFSRHHVNSNLQRAKVTGHYVNSVLARFEAGEHGYDEAILLDHTGLVAEGTGENIFLVRDGEIYTPPAVNILDGLTRRTVKDILVHEGFTLIEQSFGRDALYTADEVFLTGTAAEVTPIREIDRLPIPAPGPVTQKVQQIYLDGVRGKVDWMREWITPV